MDWGACLGDRQRADPTRCSRTRDHVARFGVFPEVPDAGYTGSTLQFRGSPTVRPEGLELGESRGSADYSRMPPQEPEPSSPHVLCRKCTPKERAQTHSGCPGSGGGLLLSGEKSRPADKTH